MSTSATNNTLKGPGTSRDPPSRLNANGKRALSTVTDSGRAPGSASTTGHQTTLPHLFAPLAMADSTTTNGASAASNQNGDAMSLREGGLLVSGDKADVVMDEGEAPGAMWRNQKAQMEMAHAWDSIVDKEHMINSKFVVSLGKKEELIETESFGDVMAKKE